MTDHSDSIAKLATGTRIVMIGRLVGRVVAIAGDILAARILGPATFGIYAIGWTIFRLVELIAPLGMDMGVIRFGSLPSRFFLSGPRTIIKFALLVAAGFGLVLAALLLLSSSWIGTSVFRKPEVVQVIRYAALVIPFAGLLVVLSAATRLTLSMKYTVILQDLGQPLMAFVLLSAFLLSGAGLDGVLLAQLASYILALLLGCFFVLRLFPNVFGGPWLFGEAPGFLHFSVFSSLTVISNTLVFWVDRLIVGYFLPAGQAGIYQALSQLSVVSAVILGSLSRIVVPILASLHHEQGLPAMAEVYKVSTKWGIYISAPVLVVLALSPRDVLSVTYGQPYAAGALALVVLLGGQIVNLVTGPVGSLLVVTGHQKFSFALAGFTLGANIFLNVLLVPLWGIIGAAAATSASLAFMYTFAVFAARRKLGLWPYDFRYWKGCVSLAVAISAVLMVKSLGVQVGLLSILLQLSAAAAAFSVMLLITKLDREDIELMHRFRDILNRPTDIEKAG